MRPIVFSVLVLTLMLGHVFPIHAQDVEARKIMEAVNDRDEGDNQTADLKMVLIDRNGDERTRIIQSFAKKKGEDRQGLMFFLHPSDVRNTAFLTYDYDQEDKDDTQWLYLPALHKTKRIATKDKNGSFMGSDLNYSDMNSRNLGDYFFKFYEKAKEKQVNQVMTWVVWCIPKSKAIAKQTGYDKALVFVRQDNYFVVRTLAWVQGSRDKKYFDVKKLEQIEGIWVGTHLTVTRKREKQTIHKTILTLDRVRFNQNLDQDMFTTRKMEKGI